MLVGLVAAWLTKQLGVYYLVGAFLTGLAARLLRGRMPLLASDDNLRAVRLFASFFVPFYFFHAGSSIPAEALGWQALLLGLLLSACALPLRVGLQWLHRRLVFQEDAGSSLRVAVTLAPTLVFTLVLISVLGSVIDSGVDYNHPLLGAQRRGSHARSDSRGDHAATA